MRNFYILFIFLVLVSCSESEPPNLHLVSGEIEWSYTAETIQNSFRLAGAGDLAQKVKYEVALYNVVYNTEYKGETIRVSGLISFPVTSDPVPMISLQHGTIATSDEAPSRALSSFSQFSWFSSFGYIMLFPDYIGYGESDEIVHPYYDEESTAKSVTSMLLAAEELANERGVTFNNNVFLAGYSEGGYATMAAHKAMEETPMEGFDLVASAPAAGGYDVIDMVDYLFQLEEYASPFYIAFVAHAYTDAYAWDQPMSLYFNEPFATDIPNLINGENSTGTINSRLTTNIRYLIKNGFRNGLKTDTEYAHIYSAFTENSLTDWAPKNKMIMYHGTSDVTVPYSNSEATYNKLVANGAIDIEFLDLEGDHSTAFIPYLTQVIVKFESMR